MRNIFNTSPSRIFAASALLVFAGFMANTPALAQGIVPGSTTSAPRATPQGATARGIKDNAVKSCGSCGLTGRVKREGGPRPGPSNGRKFNDSWSGTRIGGPGGGPRRNAQ